MLKKASRDALTPDDLRGDRAFLDFQLRWLLDTRPLLIGEKGRQQGWTWTEAAWSVRRRMRMADEGKKLNHYFSSADKETAIEFIHKAADWAGHFSLAFNQDIIDLGKDVKAFRLETPGGDIVAVSAQPKALRGKSGDVSLDEYAFRDDDAATMDAAEAVTTWGTGDEPGCLRIFSTHNGPGTLFYDMVRKSRRGDSDYHLHSVTIFDAVRDGLALKIPGDHQKLIDGTRAGRDACDAAFIESKRRRSRSEAAFKQEYLCEPISSGSLILPDLYDARSTDRKVPDRLDYHAQYPMGLYVGFDPALTHDLSVIWVWEAGWIDGERFKDVPDEFRLIARPAAIIPMRNKSLPEQWSVFDRVLSHPAVIKCYMDPANIGRPLYDAARQKFGGPMLGQGNAESGGGLVVPFALTRDRKEAILENVGGWIEQGRVELPSEAVHPDVREDFLAMRRELTDAGTIRYDGGTTFSHCDYLMAASLGLRALDKPRAELLTLDAA